jgi:hypothetical protein
MPGRVEAIRIAPEHEQLPEPVESIDVKAQGLTGDRYFGRGDITLIEEEALAAFTEETGIQLSHAEIRRQVLGIEWCEPCNHIQSLTYPGVLKGMVHRAGLRADIVHPGTITVGDEVDEVRDVAA